MAERGETSAAAESLRGIKMGRETEIYKIRISDEEALAILDRLDAEDAQEGGGHRKSSRHPLRGIGLVVTITNMGQSAISHWVKMHNISLHGAGFISTAAMLPGTMITIQLPTGKGNEYVRKAAIVRRSRLIEGVAYEVGAEFCSFAKDPSKPDRNQSAGSEV